jgi:hypothetical protein
MKTMNFMAWATHARPQGETHAFFTALRSAFCALAFLLPAFGWAQDPVEVPLSAFAYSIDAGTGTCLEGDTVWIHFSLGDGDAPVLGAHGVELTFVLGDAAAGWSDADLHADPSWLFGDGQFDATVTWAGGPHKLSISLVRNVQQGLDGAGAIFQFPVRCTGEETNVADLVTEVDGIVIVDNVELKDSMGLASARVEAFAQGSWPNPVTGMLHAPGLAGQGAWRLMDLQGKRVDVAAQLDPGELRLDLSTCKPGIYLLGKADGTTQNMERILVR